MKYLTILLLILVACQGPAGRKTAGEDAGKIHADSSSPERDTAGLTEFHPCNFDDLIADKRTPELAKSIYLNSNWNLNNDTEALALIDSLTAKDKSARPFYFKVVTMTYKKSDGYFSEALGSAGKAYVERHTEEFISNFDHKDCFTERDLLTWVDIVMLEFSLEEDEKNSKPVVEDYTSRLKAACKNCSAAQKENLDKFCRALEYKWNPVYQ